MIIIYYYHYYLGVVACSLYFKPHNGLKGPLAGRNIEWRPALSAPALLDRVERSSRSLEWGLNGSHMLP